MVKPPLRNVFVTGTGTGIGKTYVSAILTQAMYGDYWKPVQAGIADGTDSLQVASLLSNDRSVVHEEVYRLKLPASPHIAAREEGIGIDCTRIKNNMPKTERPLVVEGAGGLMVPLNENEFVADLIIELGLPVILVSRNMLGSINHSLLTAAACKQRGIPVIGWIFNDDYLGYEHEIARWTQLPVLYSVPHQDTPGKDFIEEQAIEMRKQMNLWKW